MQEIITQHKTTTKTTTTRYILFQEIIIQVNKKIFFNKRNASHRLLILFDSIFLKSNQIYNTEK